MSDLFPTQEETVDLELAQSEPVESPEDILAEPPDALDITAELAAPPRRKLPWLTLLLCGGLVAGAGFVGGVLVEKNQTPTSSFGASGRNFSASGRTGTGGGGGFGGGGFGGGGFGGSSAGGGTTIGTVKLVDGSTIYVTDTSGNIVKVTTGGSTKVSIAQSGKVSQLKPGATVTVRGAADSSGDVAATTVTQVGG
ncbi:hypothetical protein [Streptacidiphilus neutrinimicus]|uniref:hypothetical protein n=1 Tax=Streptacidiphilus neutrinimicus TaxID=105420 RepID=UPI001378384D|nr:hypothetical protein [Streptacidiphilus neutrinimicus]